METEKDYPGIVRHLSGVMREMGTVIPDTMKGFAACADSAKAATES